MKRTVYLAEVYKSLPPASRVALYAETWLKVWNSSGPRARARLVLTDAYTRQAVTILAALFMLAFGAPLYAVLLFTLIATQKR
jgi:hypothetical protein